MLHRARATITSLGFHQVRRVIVFVVGMTVLLFGIALIVLPGPAILVIPAGLAILGLEFHWARRWMRKARAMIKSGQSHLFRDRRPPPPVQGVNPPVAEPMVSARRVNEEEPALK
jgi:hypothetical protein